MKVTSIVPAILAVLACSVNLQAQSLQATNATTRASFLGGAAAPAPQPGPPPNASPEFLVAEGNALLAAGYVDAAIQDFQKAVNLAPDSSPTVSKGWYGLARCYMAQSNVELAKTSLEEVLTRNNDPESSAAARQTYGELKGRADGAVSQAQQALLYAQWRYHSTSFFNFISKFFSWRDLKKAEQNFQQAKLVADGFNPRYLIPPVGSGAAARASETYNLSAQELQNLLSRVPTEGSLGQTTVVTGVNRPAASETAGTAAAAQASVAVAAPAAVESATAAAPRASNTAASAGAAPATPVAPADDLKAKKDGYLAAYNNLQTAMGSRDPAAIQAATKAFQEAMRAYNAARNTVQSK